MSLYVAGFDFGTQNCTIAVAQKGGIDVIANEVSNRLTPTMVAFDEKQRHIGEAAATQYQRNIKNTITNLKQLIGHPWDDPELQAEIKNLPFKVVKNEKTNQPEVEVMLAGEKKCFSLVAVTAMLLVKLKEITQNACQGRICKDVVISCPGFWTDQQRRALLDAAKIAGLNCMRVFNELTATALNYGIYKTDLSDTTPIYVMFVDMGDAYTSVGVVEFLKGKLRVLSTAYDRTMGGRNYNDILVEHFLKEFKAKYKIDVRTNDRAMIRLRAAAEKLKKVLNATPEGVLNIDSLMNDIDVKGQMKREQYIEMCAPLLNRIEAPIKQALTDAGLTADKIFAVEVTGSATRFKPLQAKIAQIMGKPEVSNTLNSEESVCRGCALQCAMLSPVFRVREFSVTDISPYPIKVSWKDIGPDAMVIDTDTLEVFPRNCPVPSSKYVKLHRTKGFELIAEYVASYLPPGIPSFIGKWTITDLPPSPTGEAQKLRIKINLDLSNLVQVEAAQLETLVEEKEEPKKEEAKKDEAKKDEPKPNEETKPQESQQQQQSADAEMKDAEQKPAEPPKEEPKKEEAKKEEPKKEETPKKKKIRRIDLNFSSNTSTLIEKQINDLTEQEAQLSASDRLVFETAEKKNAVESYVYDMRNKLSESLVGYITDQDRDNFLNILQATEDWLYNEGDEQTKSVYVAKLNELKAIGDPIVFRKVEAEERPHAIKELKQAILAHRLTATNVDPKYEHIPPEDKQKIVQKCDELEKELNNLIVKQDKLPKHADPAFLAGDLIKKKQDLDNFANPIMNRPKPPPKPAEPPKEEAKKEETKKEETKAEEPKKEQNKEQNGSKMDEEPKKEQKNRK